MAKEEKGYKQDVLKDQIVPRNEEIVAQGARGSDRGDSIMETGYWRSRNFSQTNRRGWRLLPNKVEIYENAAEKIADHYADAGNTSTNESDLYSDTIPVNTLTVNGQKIVAEYVGIIVGHATATRNIKVYFGTVAGAGAIYATGAVNFAANTDWHITVTIIRDTSTTVRCVTRFISTALATGVPVVGYIAVTTLVFTDQLLLKITGQAGGVGAATNDIVAKLGTVRWQGEA
jgi:hypothetical protein